MTNLILSICASMNAYNAPRLDCNLVLKVAKIESNLNAEAIGASHGELGLFQVRPSHHKCASLDPAKNTRCAINYLKMVHRKHYKKHGECFVTFYNYGINSKITDPCNKKYYKKLKFTTN